MQRQETFLEDVLGVKQLLYLGIKAQPHAAVAEHIGRLLAMFRHRSSAFAHDVAQVWARHIRAPGALQQPQMAGKFGGKLAPEMVRYVAANTSDEDTRGYIPLIYAERIFAENATTHSAPEEPADACHVLLSMLGRVASRTAFEKTNDLWVHTFIALLLPAHMHATVSAVTSPVQTCTKVHGREVNTIVGPIVHEPVSDHFEKTQWATSCRPQDLLLLVVLLSEIFQDPPDMTIGTLQCREQQGAVPDILLKPYVGYKIRNTVFEAHRGRSLPLPSLLVSFVRTAAIMGCEAACELIDVIDHPQNVAPLSPYFSLVT